MSARTRQTLAGLAMVAAAGLGAPCPASAQGRPSPAPAAAEGASPLFRKVTVRGKEIRLGDALASISQQANIGLIYGNRIVPVERRITVSLSGVTAEEALRSVLAGTDVEFIATVSGQVVFRKRQLLDGRS